MIKLDKVNSSRKQFLQTLHGLNITPQVFVLILYILFTVGPKSGKKGRGLWWVDGQCKI